MMNFPRTRFLLLGLALLTLPGCAEVVDGHLKIFGAGEKETQTVSVDADDARSLEVQEAIDQAQNPMIRGLLEGMPAEVQNQLNERGVSFTEELLEADALLTKVKMENAEAIVQANRQVPVSRASTPNIILISIDGLMYGDLYDQEKISLPNIDALMQSSVRFKNFYASSTNPVASRWSMMTGKNVATRSQINFGQNPVPVDRRTVSEAIYMAGYTTHFLGDWGASTEDPVSPRSLNFNSWYGTLTQKEALEFYPKVIWENGKPNLIAANQNGEKKQHIHSLYTNHALSYIKGHQRGRRPFYLQIHMPFSPDHPDLADGQVYDNTDWTAQQKSFAESLTALDKSIGKILAQLDELKIRNQTAIVLTGTAPRPFNNDLVTFFNRTGPLKTEANRLSEGDLRIPLIMSWPRGMKTTGESDHIGIISDVMPTLAAAARRFPLGCDPDGISFLPTVMNSKQKQHELLLWKETQNGKLMQAVRLNNWKAVVPLGTNQVELYNLGEDLDETDNVAGENPEVLKQVVRNKPQA